MPINSYDNYIEFGTECDSDFNLANSISLPVPVALPFATEYFADAGRNSDGVMLLQEVGREQYRTKITWQKLKNTTWWRLNRWFSEFGNVFYVKFFNHNLGKVQVRRFYKGAAPEPTPSPAQEIIDGISVPKYYNDVTLSVIDMGESETYDILTLGVGL